MSNRLFAIIQTAGGGVAEAVYAFRVWMEFM
jgi:hypothetical protein